MSAHRKLALSGALLAAGLTISSVAPAVASTASTAQAPGDEVFLAAGLRGANEVGARGDADGRSTVVLRISGDQVTFAARWNGIDPPTAGHVHSGAKGVDGDVRLEFFARPLPKTALGVTGTVTADPALIQALLADPGAFYANLHDAEHPKGTVRGQFHRLNRPIDLNGVLQGSGQATLSAGAGGAQEVPAGDQDGQAVWWLRPHGSAIGYTASWTGLGTVTDGHVHQGAPGRNGDVVAGLFGDARGLPANLTGIAGDAPVPSKVVKRIAADPGRYYANLRTRDLPKGAVRGQLSGAAFTHPRAVTADVLDGAQIYACTEQNGTTAYTQLGVSATLRQGIAHSFVTPAAGPPQWIAPDGSAVRGTVVTRTPNGDGNIPELVLDAAQAGTPAGLLSHATQVVRLNTVGGTAPAGTCVPGATVRVPYRADYLFLG